MKELDLYSFISLILVLIGGINWGLIGIFNVNLLAAILGGLLSRLLFIAVGVGAGYLCYQMYLQKVKKV
jgi:uncharacterized membrane protein YuzA (DUF378 family)